MKAIGMMAVFFLVGFMTLKAVGAESPLEVRILEAKIADAEKRLATLEADLARNQAWTDAEYRAKGQRNVNGVPVTRQEHIDIVAKAITEQKAQLAEMKANRLTSADVVKAAEAKVKAAEAALENARKELKEARRAAGGKDF